MSAANDTPGDQPVYHTVTHADHPKAIPNTYIVSIHNNLDLKAHIEELKREMEADKVSAATEDTAHVESEIGNVMDVLQMYSGKFSPGVVEWLKTNKDVKYVEQDIMVSLD